MLRTNILIHSPTRETYYTIGTSDANYVAVLFTVTGSATTSTSCSISHIISQTDIENIRFLKTVTFAISSGDAIRIKELVLRRADKVMLERFSISGSFLY
jgi:hypothetical protein